jgi:hypothetical protein
MSRNYQNSRPVSISSRRTKALNRGNSIPVVAISPRGNTHIYPSITEFVRDVEGLDNSQRRTANRRVTSGGGYVDNWYVTELRGYNG